MGNKLKNFVLLALFVALIVLLGFTPLGLIPLGFINVTILCVPVIIGTLFMGWKSGLILGLAFGLTSFISALIKPSALVATLMGASPLCVAVMSILPRLCVPLSAWGVYSLLKKKHENIAVSVAAVAGSLTNTVLYLGLMLLFYVLCGIDATSVLALIGGTALIAGSCEAAVAAIICTPILAALRRVSGGKKARKPVEDASQTEDASANQISE
ncbi:MAG: ECF transporter S component [Clostridia bacterium]|nr:ECF transporter S component [Clostridia bacterium]